MRIFPTKALSESWLKAAVIGSVWASFEIVAGSFLHNLKIPFSGTLLTSFSVYLLIAFFQQWKQPGVIWRAGLVCALMKSLSPSAVILGPMVGILTEALILWLMIILFGKNLFSYILGGALAVVSALFHKVGSLLILYGFNLVKIAEGVYAYAIHQLNIASLDPKLLIGIILVGYLVIGAMAAILGYLSGKKFTLNGNTAARLAKREDGGHNGRLAYGDKHPYSLLLLIAHLVSIVLCLWSINYAPSFVSAGICSVYIAVCLSWYKGSARFLRKWSFWIQFILVTLLASLVFEGISSGEYFSINGLVVGLMMNLRAFVIMAGFTAISYELRNPLIKAVLYRKGFSSLYQSLSLAFSALPDIIANLPEAGKMIRQRKSVVASLLATSYSLLEDFRQEPGHRPPIIILSGRVGEGKTTYLLTLLGRIREKGIKTGGIIAPGIKEGGKKVGFYLEDLSSGQRSVLSSKASRSGWTRTGHYYFDPEVVKKGNDILLRCLEQQLDLVVIDEVGHMELHNGGWAPAIEELCSSGSSLQLWVVRESLVEKIARKWNVGEVYVYTINIDTPDAVLAGIEQLFFSGAPTMLR